MAIAAVDPINASRVPARLSQFRCAAQAATAGAVRDRIPDTMPIAKARTKTKVALIEGDVSRLPSGVKKYEMKEKDGGNRAPPEFGGSRSTGGHSIFSCFRSVNSVAFSKWS
jgi:hypothetical protein